MGRVAGPQFAQQEDATAAPVDLRRLACRFASRSKILPHSGRHLVRFSIAAASHLVGVALYRSLRSSRLLIRVIRRILLLLHFGQCIRAACAHILSHQVHLHTTRPCHLHPCQHRLPKSASPLIEATPPSSTSAGRDFGRHPAKHKGTSPRRRLEVRSSSGRVDRRSGTLCDR